MNNITHNFPEHFYQRYNDFISNKSASRYQYDLDWSKFFPLVNGICRCGCGGQTTSYTRYYNRKKGTVSIAYRRWIDKEHGRLAYIFFSFIKGMPNGFFNYLADLQGWKCKDCGSKKEYSSDLEADHNVAIVLGGNNLPDNWQLLCHQCHVNKTKIDMLCYKMLKGKLRISTQPLFQFLK